MTTQDPIQDKVATQAARYLAEQAEAIACRRWEVPVIVHGREFIITVIEKEKEL